MKGTIKAKLLNAFVIIGIVLTFLLIAVMSVLGFGWMVKLYASDYCREYWCVAGGMVSMYLCAIPFAVALFELKKITKCLRDDEIFSMKVSRTLKNIAVCAFIETAVCAAVTAFLMTCTTAWVFMPIIAFVAAAIGLLAICMAEVFERAAKMKEENDSIF
ncbi:MAG: DUF2975 domain-containing protein [Clostridia bacterium]|nr:DUF2975 domain-containing protein [Clostridia bacterium]